MSIYVESRRRSGARLQTLVRVVVCFGGGGGRRWHKQEEEEGETGSAAIEFVRWVACNDMRTLVSSCGCELRFKPWVQLPASSKLEIIDPFHNPNNFFMLPNQVSNVGMSLLQGSIGGAAPNNFISAVAINMPVVSSSSSSSSPESFKSPHLQLITPRPQ